MCRPKHDTGVHGCVIYSAPRMDGTDCGNRKVRMYAYKKSLKMVRPDCRNLTSKIDNTRVKVKVTIEINSACFL